MKNIYKIFLILMILPALFIISSNEAYAQGTCSCWGYGRCDIANNCQSGYIPINDCRTGTILESPGLCDGTCNCVALIS